jgi:hypothetical protein
MNRWLVAALALIAVSIASVYLLIPSHLVVTKIELLNCNRDAADRVLQDTAGWVRWWPGTERKGRQLLYRGAEFRMSQRLNKGAEILIDYQGREVPSVLNIFSLIRRDSSFIQWQFSCESGWDPLRRIGQYRRAKKLKEDMGVIMDSLRHFAGNTENVYGIAIEEASTNDSFLVETSRKVKGYPGTAVIYGVVHRLESFAARRGGTRTGFPMLNVDPEADGEYEMKVAIPVDLHLTDSGDVVFRKLVRGSYLESNVSGGPGAVNAALGRIGNYIADYRRTVMAIPFFSLVTDRTAEPDSAKWVTRIYYPIY